MFHIFSALVFVMTTSEVIIIDNVVFQLVTVLIGFALGAVVIIFYRKISSMMQLSSAEQQAKQIIKKAEEDARVIVKSAELDMKDKLVQLREELTKRFNKEQREKRDEIRKEEKRLAQKESKLDKKLDDVERRERELNQKEQEIAVLKDEIESLRDDQIKKLEEVAGMTAEQAKNELLNNLERELQMEMARRVKENESEIKQVSDRKARWILATAVQRCALDHTVDSLVSVVSLPDEDMKGRIIGREGRNIRALEALTGISVIIDDTPQAVVLSGFNNIKREIARLSLEKLIHDGRIHPARIEEVVAKTTADLEKNIIEIGETTAIELGIHGLHPELIKLIGKLQYRTSYGQNQLQHTIEVAHLAANMAAEIGADIQLAKRSGLLHDIGKVVSQEVEGSHAIIGADLAKKYGEPEKVVNAIRAHHEDEEPMTVEAVLIAAADAISAAREGARHETVEAYVKRIEKLEEISLSFKEVTKAYALQAGREIRVIVDPGTTDDTVLAKLTKDIRQRIEKEMEFPGQIKIVVIRETRAVEYAK